MPNLFLNIPAPAANGAGAPVDVSAMGKVKSIVCGGGFTATVNVEYSTDAGGVTWAPLATFQQAGNLTIDVAAHWMRAVTSDYKSGAPNVDVGSSDAGTLFALLTADGASVDISALPLFKTAVLPGGIAGIIEISEDGVSWAQIFSMPNGGAQSRQAYGRFARVGSGGADVTLAGANDAPSAGPAESAFALLNYDWQGDNVAGQKNIASVAVVGVGIRDFTFTSPLAPYNPDQVVITVSAEPIVTDLQINPPVQIYGKIMDANTLRVTAYPTQAAIAGNPVDPTNSLLVAHVRVDVIAV